jgi:hypothetical protein
VQPWSPLGNIKRLLLSQDDKGQNMSLPRDILFTATGNPKESEVTQYDVFDLPPSLEHLAVCR